MERNSEKHPESLSLSVEKSIEMQGWIHNFTFCPVLPSFLAKWDKRLTVAHNTLSLCEISGNQVRADSLPLMSCFYLRRLCSFLSKWPFLYNLCKCVPKEKMEGNKQKMGIECEMAFRNNASWKGGKWGGKRSLPVFVLPSSKLPLPFLSWPVNPPVGGKESQGINKHKRSQMFTKGSFLVSISFLDTCRSENEALKQGNSLVAHSRPSLSPFLIFLAFPSLMCSEVQ